MVEVANFHVGEMILRSEGNLPYSQGLSCFFDDAFKNFQGVEGHLVSNLNCYCSSAIIKVLIDLMIRCLGLHFWKERTDFDQGMDFFHPYIAVDEVGLALLNWVAAIELANLLIASYHPTNALSCFINNRGDPLFKQYY